MKEDFTVTNGKVNIRVQIHEYNGVHHYGVLIFKGNAGYIDKIREAFGPAIVSIEDNQE